MANHSSISPHAFREKSVGQILQIARRLSVADLMARPSVVPRRSPYRHPEPEPPHYSKLEMHILARAEEQRDSIGDGYLVKLRLFGLEEPGGVD
ncbi:MAG: hypothetical protein M1370_01920 [Bacteroidetes bacterium]|nr:hypothetical protein [Bacteroidota bacterium]